MGQSRRPQVSRRSECNRPFLQHNPRKDLYVTSNDGVRKRKQPYVAHLSREAFRELKTPGNDRIPAVARRDKVNPIWFFDLADIGVWPRLRPRQPAMAKGDDIPKTDPSQIEALIQRLKQSNIEPRDAQLVERLLRLVLSMASLLQHKNASIKRLKRLIFGPSSDKR
jgi:hypothetical protein